MRLARCLSDRCHRGAPHDEGECRSGEDSSPRSAIAHDSGTPTISDFEPSLTPSPQLSEQSRGLYQHRDIEGPSKPWKHFCPPMPQVGPLNTSENEPRTTQIPITQHDPNNPKHILKLLRKGVKGGATCLWPCEGYECGFSSQVYLVKRHIKRVHYRLR